MIEKNNNFCDIAVFGMGTMGSNLARNMANRGIKTLLWNRNLEKAAFIAGENPCFRVAVNPEDVLTLLQPPRKVMLMLPAGQVTTELTDRLKDILEQGDIVINGANSSAEESDILCDSLAQKDILYLGTGISGGAQGALDGPSIMAGGSEKAWKLTAPLLQKCAAAAPDGSKCAAYFGRGGAGHLVKIVHNGIEYAQMEIIAEIYDVLKNGCSASAPVIADFFAEQSQHNRCRSFLTDLTVKILQEKDPETGLWLIDFVADKAESKGTGLTCLGYALQHGIPVPALAQAVQMRQLSASSLWRSSRIPAVCAKTINNREHLLPRAAGRALKAAMLAAFAEGFALLEGIFSAKGMSFSPALAAGTWSSGCIIRSELLELWRNVPTAKDNRVFPATVDNMLLQLVESWQSFSVTAAEYGIPVPAVRSALDYYILSARSDLATALTAAQRDAFGNHLFRRKNSTRYEHHNWRLPL